MIPQASRQKRAELAGAVGAGTLGVGLGALLAEWAAAYALFLLVVGVFLHGWGMLEKRRLEAGGDIPAWANVLYWLCWVALAALMAWLAIRAFRD
ncbi:MAG: hypothetical protein K0R40_1763 [Burkholderiales bacterium]|jgi:hypothetical protein|nr:hypothetical protein [Burkholderiales bacterium]